VLSELEREASNRYYGGLATPLLPTSCFWTHSPVAFISAWWLAKREMTIVVVSGLSGQ
jgi:hypothetical protein